MGGGTATTGNTLLLFGPQSLSFNQHSFDQLRSTLSEGHAHGWILETVAELPAYWTVICGHLPQLQAIDGGEWLADLARWFKTGAYPDSNSRLPNTLLTPLVVLAQLAQYSRNIKLGLPSHTTADRVSAFSAPPNTSTLGFCTGILSAFAVSCSATQEDFEKYGAVAVRLAMLIGALVDAQDESDKIHGRAKSYATAWNSPEQGVDLARILDQFPEAYISVRYDERRATLTTSQQSASTLLQQLKGTGIIASEVGLRGRFHYQNYFADLDSIITLCDAEQGFQLPDASNLILPSYTNVNGEPIRSGSLHQLALRGILMEQSNWYNTFAAVQASLLNNDSCRVVSFGPDRFVPPSLMRKLGSHLVHAADLDQDSLRLSASVLDPDAQRLHLQDSDDNDIAVIGMAIKVAGADDLEEFWSLNCEGKSQHTEVPESRFGFQTHWREPETQRKWYGNFVRDVDAFDHKFFKRSPREAASMDPQQRLMWQAAYQAVEMSGYFATPNPDKHIGCYIGACAADYEHNVACYAPNAFTATGNLKSFIPGKISHYFGWTGPGMTIDTACSASAVAIHMACRAILTGECTGGALAGGVATMSNPIWFQNLAGATFLSPTGQCKPFDELADGYCRGEGIACVFLKKMSSAVADGNQIFGCISSTAVFQNQNCTPLFVPNSPSLSTLFRDVVRRARLKPEDISVVEAHGTGTPVGDPAEYESIRLALGGPIRSTPLLLGSVKGLIGHTEGTSGVISLIKVILMMHEGRIPPQASYSKMSHHIKTTPTDLIEVPTSLRAWSQEHKAALINNYGASGSNASIVVTQSMHLGLETASMHSRGIKHPFWIPALDDRSLSAYRRKLSLFIQSKGATGKGSMTLSNLSFNLSRQTNRSLPHGLMFSCASLAELENQLHETASVSIPVKASRPVVLSFGGQVSTFIGLDPQVYETVKIFRSYLDQCNSVIQSLGLDSIYPAIFQQTPIEDTVVLQTALFSMQYACARSWMDCGVTVAAVVGHSFGEITGLCISGILSLRDTIKLVAGRAKLVRDSWNSDRGAMMAVEGDLATIERLVTLTNQQNADLELSVCIACYNGPRSFTIAGHTTTINRVSEILSRDDAFASVKTKRLNVTNAFHSALVEPLISSLKELGRDLIFKKPFIPLERATESHTSAETISSNFIAEHLRRPVYFNHALQRLAQKYSSCIWLEAGSNSTITHMASRALSPSKDSYFQAVNLGGDRALHNLTDTTVSLWKEGLRITFWPHHTLQTYDYAPLFLPPYQFEKHRHWMDLKAPRPITNDSPVVPEEKPLSLWTFVGYQDAAQQHARFRVNTMTQQYKDFVSGHVIAQTAAICPATLEVDMAIEAIRSLRLDLVTAEYQPQILDMQNHVPICVDPSLVVWLDFEQLPGDANAWIWKILSQKGSVETVHVKGTIRFFAKDDPRYHAEFARYERMVSHKRCLAILESDDDADDIILGRNVYRTFAEIVSYGEMYRGVRKVVGKGNECAGHVQMKYMKESWLDVFLSDCFSQVGGLWVNCMTDRAPSDMYIATGCEVVMRSPKVDSSYNRPETWDVLATHHRESEKLVVTDVYIFDPTNGRLMEVMFGIQYIKVAKASMIKILSRLTAPEAMPAATSPTIPPSKDGPKEASLATPPAPSFTTADVSKQTTTPTMKVRTARPDLSRTVREIIANVSGLEPDEIKDDSELADFGIDSLMGMELTREVESVFKCTLDQEELMDATNFRKFVQCITAALYPDDANMGDGDGDSDDPNDTARSASLTSVSTPQTSHTESPPGEAAEDIKYESLPQKDDLQIAPSTVFDAFGESKMLTDQFIRDYKVDNFADVVLSKSTQLCVTLILEAFETLGVFIRDIAPGQTVPRIRYEPQHERLVQYLYELLENDARLIDIQGTQHVRTAISAPKKPSETLLQDLLAKYPEWTHANNLTFFAGKHLADVLQDKTDGIRVIFGTAEGRELVTALYCEHSFNQMSYCQMRDFIGRLIARLPLNDGPLKILEMGAGTGGTTLVLAPFLAELNVPVEYTFTDLAPSMVAQARRRFKVYPFMKFAVHDIEKPPAEELRSQHIVIASNAVHATHNLTRSASNIRTALRPDGFLMMLEMTAVIPFIEVVFGLLEGWWLFDDGRRHAIAPASRWEHDLQAAGFGHVDWTDGILPENEIQKIIIAMASKPIRDRLPKPQLQPAVKTDDQAREAVVSRYVAQFSQGFTMPAVTSGGSSQSQYLSGNCVLLTGATGSLGSHLVEQFALHPNVHTVVCVNRRSRVDPETRQREALSTRGIVLAPDLQAKLRVIETDTSKPNLGLTDSEYEWLAQNVTHIAHNAWPMSGTRPIQAFEPQFQIMRNLIDLARDVVLRRPAAFKVRFELVSSIGVVGQYPLWSGRTNVPEERMELKSVLPIGYCEAKFTCERILEATLHQFPEYYSPMSVRLGQVAGSRTSGYWNPVEHFSFLIKSCQSLKALPDFDGILSWVPVNDVAATLCDLLIAETIPYPIYHIDNPVGQPWREMIEVLADALAVPHQRIIPFDRWVKLVRSSPLSTDTDNPAGRLIDFLDDHFLRMSCGGLLLDTTLTKEHSPTLAAQGHVSADVARKYVQKWKEMRFLHA